MPAPPAPGIVALDAIWVSANEPVENTFHYHVAGTIDVALLEAMAHTYFAWVTAHANLFSTSTQCQKVYLEDLTTSTSASTEVNPPAPIDGTDPSTNLPNNATWTVKRVTGLRGRANRGRIYWIGLTEGDLDASSQQITAARAALRVAAMGTLTTAQFADNGATEVIYHKAAGTGTPVVAWAYADLFLDSQRRRLPGHNRHH